MEKDKIKELLESYVSEDGAFDLEGAAEALAEQLKKDSIENDGDEAKKKEAFDKVTEKYKK